jgi:hypothetical protein
MAANAAAAGELERMEEIRKVSPIPTLEPALCRALSTSSRGDHKGEWPSIGRKSVMNPTEIFKKKTILHIKR